MAQQIQKRKYLSFKLCLPAYLRNSRGFSLIEILISLTLMAIAGAFVATKIFDRLHEGRVKATIIQMQSLKAALNDFRRHCHFYPLTEQGLEGLINKPGGRECARYSPNGYLDGDEVPVDPWESEYAYESDGRSFTLYSYGADQQEGGEEQDQDIYLNKKKSDAKDI